MFMGPKLGGGFCALSCSGGEAGLVADLADDTPLAFPPLSTVQEDNLRSLLGPLVTLSNPLDYHTFIWGDLDKTTSVSPTCCAPMTRAFTSSTPPRSDLCDPASFEPALEAIALAGKATGKPAFAVASLPENFDEQRAIAMMQAGVVPLQGIETALAAVAAARVPAGDGWRPWSRSKLGETHVLDEVAGKAMLSDWGVRVPRGVSAVTLDTLAESAEGLARPLAVKGLGFAHKTEAGAVQLNIRDVGAVPAMPDATGYLAEEMVTGSVAEIIVGLTQDPVYGATLMIGFGGVQAEILADTQTLVLPVTAAQVHAAIHALRLAPLLSGHRGGPLADVAAVVDVVLKLQSAIANNPEIAEIEINPLMVCHSGAIAVDALIRKETS